MVPTYNRKDPLAGCLAALLRQTFPLDEILVVDNASTDGTADMIHRTFRERVTVQRLPRNTGSAGGFYEGIRIACAKGYDWVWCMDNDAEAAPDSLEALTASPKFRDPEVGAVAALVVDQDSKVQAMHHKRRVMPFEAAAFTGGQGDNREAIPLAANGWAGVLIRRSAIEAAGLPRREFFVFFEDTEYTYRISREFKIFLIPRSRVLHKSDARWVKKIGGGRVESPRWPSDQPWRLYYDVRNRFFFVTRQAKPWGLVFVAPLLLARKLAGIILFDDHKLKRMGVMMRGLRDAVMGRLEAAPAFKKW